MDLNKNNMENQRKRPEQIKFSKDTSFYAIVGLILTIGYIILTK
jgi:hypothetical protein